MKLGGLFLPNFHSLEAISNDGMDLIGDSSEDPDAQLLTYFCKASIFCKQELENSLQLNCRESLRSKPSEGRLTEEENGDDKAVTS